MSNGPTTGSTIDRAGVKVIVGISVRVLAIRPSVFDRLPEQERLRVQTMLGEIFPVYEIDNWGSAWVEKWWRESEDSSSSHSLALEPAEMEVVSDGRA